MITVYSAWADDFSGLGICALTPEECVVREQAGGTFRLEMTHPMDDTGRWWNLLKYNIIKAPCPVRETPKINAGSAAPGQAVTRKVYSVSVNTRLRLRTKPSTSKGKIIGRYKNGTKVLRIGESGEWYEVVIKKGGATGWMHSNYLRYVGEETEVIPGNDAPPRVIEPRETREQLFEIREISRDDAAGKVYVTALHISYKMIGWTVKGEYNPKDTPVTTALAEIVDKSKANDDFSFYCTAVGNITGEFRGRGLLSAILENDGLAVQTRAKVIRDNFDFFLLNDEARDRGVQIRHRKNLTGAILLEDVSEVITRIIPVGKTKKGDSLYLDGQIWVECPDATNIPNVSEKEIQYDVKVGELGFETTAKARTELKRLAMLEFTKNGLHLGATGLEVDFVKLEEANTQSVVQNYAALQAVYLYDLVRVISDRSGIDAKLRVTGYAYDCLKKRYTEVVLGELYALNSGISGFDITGNISGSKVIVGSLDGDRVRDMSIQYAKIAAAAIEQLNAEAITALTARINEIVAGSITTDSLYAALAEIITLRVKTITADKIETDELYAALADVILLRAQQINADNINADTLAAQYAEIVALLVENIKAEEIQTDRLGAVLAEFVSMYASVGEFDFATIQNLVSKALALEQGSMDTVYIKNLAVTSANLLSATLGKLVLKGDDGKYYRVFVGADGGVRTEEVVLTDAEIADGKTEGGQQIVETDMNVGSLNASNLQANSAIINEILTIALTAEKITAADAMIASATIPALYATTIKAIGDSLDLSANISIRQMVSGRSKIFYQEDMPEEYDPGNLWIVPSTGKTYHAIGLPGGSLTEIVVNDDFEFVFRYPPEAEGLDFLIDRYGDLLTNTEYIQLDEDGTLFAFRAWVEVPVSELHTSYIDIMQDIIRIRSGGNIEIGAGGAFNVDAGSAHFKTSDFALSILAEDGSEDTVLDFDAGSKTLRADEVKAENIRDFFPGTTTVTAAEIGGLDGLAGMLAAAQYEHVVYTQTTSDASSEVIEFNACDSMLVEIEGFAGCVVPPLAFNRLTGRMLLKNLSWNCPEQTALYADSGNVMLRRCTADAQTGVHATGNANVVWIGDDEAMTAGGACTTAFLSDEGADVKLFGLIPSGERTKVLAGTITEINVRTGAGVEVDQPDKTVTIKATLGYYGTNSGWNGGAMYQGYTSGKGRIYGCMQFDLPEEITRIKAATLTLHRVSGAGSGSNINVTVYASATEFKSRPSLGDQVAHRDKAAGTGESCTLDVTEGAKALLDGTAKQLVLYTGESKTASGVVYSRHYGKFDSAKLKITY